MRALDRQQHYSRRSLLRGAGAATLAATVHPVLHTGTRGAALVQTPATRDISGTTLKILQWSHFVPRYDEWFDQALVPAWAEANGVEVTVDHVSAVDLPSAIAAEMAGAEGHDLIEYVAPLPQYEPSVLDLTDVVQEANRRHGEQLELARSYSFNPTTEIFYGFCHGYAPDPGNYRKSLWEQVGLPDGPTSWQELLDSGSRIRQEQGIQLGIGMSNEDDSNMAAMMVLMAFGASVQDANENVVINSPETVAAVEYMTRLYEGAMTPEVFGWNPASNNQLLIAGQASYILNSISAYRSAQTVQPEVAADIFFTPPLAGPDGVALANGHAVFVYMIPNYAEYPDTAKEFLLHLAANYEQATLQSELYNLPAWPDLAPELVAEGGWLDADPYNSEPADKLAVLKDAADWSVNLGYPGPSNAAIGEVFTTYVLPNMFAAAARGELTPAEAVAEAEDRITPIFERWRGEGLIGGGQ
ncbi:MAG: ABC transporter substrate-binding protein [Thermomicrobiales bacterium]